MIIGANPRREAPVLNARIRKRWLKGGFKIGVIGEKADLTYDYAYLGAGPETLASFAEHPPAKIERPMFLIGQGALARAEGASVLALALKAAASLGVIKDGWNGFGVLHTAAARVGSLDLGFVPGDGGLDAVAIYQGTHGDRGAARADVILPGATYTEKSGLYVNTEGRVQLADRANFPPGDAREDWAILRALSEVLGVKLPFDSLTGLRMKLYADFPHFAKLDQIADAGPLAAFEGSADLVDKTPFISPVADYFLTNPIARASSVMTECSALARSRQLVAAE
jgi:NADH-quinone oxidoreductase subunit G